MRKYIIRNCPACYLYENRYGCENNHDEQGRDTYCELIDDCIMKQIVEKCKKEIRVYRNTLLPDDGTNTLHFGRQSFAYDILKLLDIQEVE